MPQREADVVQDLFAVDGLRKPFNSENLVSDLAVRAEVKVRIFSAGWFDLVKLAFLKRTFSVFLLI